MSDLKSHLNGQSSMVFKWRLAYVYFGQTFFTLTLIAGILIVLNGLHKGMAINLGGADYFMQDQLIERHLEPYLLTTQLIVHGYLTAVSYLFLRDLKVFAWLEPLFGRKYLLALIGVTILLGMIIIRLIIIVVSSQLGGLLPLPMHQGLKGLEIVYLALLYTGVGMFQKPVLLIGLYLSAAFGLLYPVMNPTMMKIYFQALGLYASHLETSISLSQVIGLAGWIVILGHYRFYKKNLF